MEFHEKRLAEVLTLMKYLAVHRLLNSRVSDFKRFRNLKYNIFTRKFFMNFE